MSNEFEKRLLLAIVLLPALAIPFFNLQGILVLMLVILYFWTILFFFHPLEGFFALFLLRPLMDTFTDQSIFEMGPISLNLSALLALLVILHTSLLLLKNPDRIKNLPLKTPWLIFIGISALSILISLDAVTSVTETIRLVSIFSLFLMGYILISSKKKFFQFLSVIALSALIPGIFAYWQFFTGTGMTVPFEGVYNRIYGTLAHPSSLAFFLVIVISACIMLLFHTKNDEKNQSNRVLLFVAIVLYVSLLGLTYTRGAWLAFLLVISIIGILQYRVLLYTLIFLLLFSYMTFDPIRVRVNDTLTLTPTGSIAWRISLWKESVLFAAEKPILGHGIGTASDVILAGRGKQFGSTEPHNDYLKLALETGALGLLSYLFLMFSNMRLLAKKYFHLPKESDEKFVSVTLLSIAVSLFVVSFADNILRNMVLQWNYWALLGAYFGAYRK